AMILLTKHKNGAAQHHQHERAISVYLWLRYPDRYYIYQYSEVKAAAEVLESNYSVKPGAYAANIRNAIKFYDEICDALQRDTGLVNLFRAQLTDTCYPDPKLKTLTADVARYIHRNYVPMAGATPVSMRDWYPTDYDPGLTVADWVALLNDKKIFTEKSLAVMRRIKDYGGQATCKQLSVKYGETPWFYNGVSIGLAQRVAEKTGCPVPRRDVEDSYWWPVLYIGKRGGKESAGNFIWKLRNELAQALDQVDLSQVPLYVGSKEAEAEPRYWWLNANPKIWSFSGIAIGEAQAYTLYNENGNKRRVFQHFLDAKPGDVVIGYESNPVKQVVALAKISVAQDGEKLYFEKTEDLVSPIDYRTLKECPELAKMEYFVSPQGSLFQLTKGEFDFIMDIIRDENPLPSVTAKDTYTKEDFLAEVYLTEERYDQFVAVLQNKKNIILQGAQGVGKTFAAKRLAYSMMGEKDE
ncbi:MAG: restriction endonuclease, partial [Negativicoccus succinicivorans]|nr:restriction endonuclease [Negativicoccus succinicivorans]